MLRVCFFAFLRLRQTNLNKFSNQILNFAIFNENKYISAPPLGTGLARLGLDKVATLTTLIGLKLENVEGAAVAQ